MGPGLANHILIRLFSHNILLLKFTIKFRSTISKPEMCDNINLLQ